MICTACGKPPVNNQKLLICRRCQCALYHDADCQRQDWKCHKKVCASLGSFFIPLRRIMTNGNLKIGYYWWETVTERDREIYESCWHRGYRLWYENQDYLEAMKCFQDSLAPYSEAWDTWNKLGDQPLHVPSPISSEIEYPSTITAELGTTFRLALAKRLLFCAYCEIDGQSIDLGRLRLVQCLSILLMGSTSSWTKDMRDIWDASWMELVLSLEEADEQQQFAKLAAALALDQHIDDKIPKPCGWTNAWQRPGFMSGSITCPTRTTPPYFGVHHDYPQWCQQLEQNFHTILEEFENLRTSSLGWSTVGSGDRGSGMTDHRVVAGQDWSEYVLFGTGQQYSLDATKTRSLIRRIIPDAVSLADQGGGEVIFSRLAPRTHIRAHCGPTNLRWTAHLGLVVPKHSDEDGPRCHIRVGEGWYCWELGKVLLFDDSFEHEVRNDTDEDRVVLLLRFWHPRLPIECRNIALLQARQSKSDAVENRYHPPKPFANISPLRL